MTGKTFGIIGTGAIGCRTAEIAKAPSGMRVVRIQQKQARGILRQLCFQRRDLPGERCFRCTAANGGNAPIVNRDTLARMKPSAIIINTARGALIDSGALTDALNAGNIYAAGLMSSKGNRFCLRTRC
ncbi:MAG: NAD(P)-dependent oxidoreductase [Eubacteriales bacterium]